MSKLDLTKPVQTRQGHKARIICTDRKGNYPIVALITYKRDNESVFSYTEEGKYSTYESNHKLDLINVPEQTVGFINWYSHPAFGLSYGKLHTNYLNAREAATRNSTEPGITFRVTLVGGIPVEFIRLDDEEI